MWIDNGENYALVGLEVKLEGELPPENIAPNLQVLTETTFDVPSEWWNWIGSIRTDQIQDSNLFLVSKLKSTTPDVPDGECHLLQLRVQHFYIGLLLSATFSPSHAPIMLTGSRKDDNIDIQQQMDLALPVPQVFRPYPPLTSAEIRLAAQLAQHLEAMQLDTEPIHLLRLLRTMNIYVEARANAGLLDRIHQYCRCIDGLILPAIGKTKRQFKSRTELFIGPKHHNLMEDLYNIRSKVEHLHENQYLETFDREIRLDLVKKEATVEYIARSALARIVCNKSLWSHFGNTGALEEYWSLSLDERRGIWGDPIEPLEAIKEFDPKYLHDGHLQNDLLGF